MKILGMAVAAAALGCLAGIQAAEAAHCRPGKYDRPSRGVCVTEAAFRRDVRHVSHRQRASRHAAQRAERVRVVYVERPVPVYVERAAPRPAQAAEAVAPAPVTTVQAAPVATAQVAAVQASPAPAEPRPQEAEIRPIAAIPFQAVGQQSLNPLPPKTRGWEWSR